MSDVDVFIRLLPFQLIESGARVFIRRGARRIAFEGDGIADTIAKLQEMATDNFVSRRDLLAPFAPVHHDRIVEFLRHLAKNRLVNVRNSGGVGPEEPVPSETQEDVFFWQFGMTGNEIRQVTDFRIAIVGLNQLGLGLRDRLSEFGNWATTLVDDIPLRNHAIVEAAEELKQFCVKSQRAEEAEEIVQSCTLVVACAEFGGIGLLKPWNALAFRQGKPFLPVLIEDATIRLGPLVIPEQTACLACLDVRHNSHLREKVHDHRLIEALLPQGQAFVGAHPAVTAIAGNLAAFEILRFSANLSPRRVGKLIEMNLMGSSMIASRVLKAPRCPVCSPLRHASKVNLEKTSLNPERWAQVEAMGGRNGAD
ncbi:TOMM precursor leader peptide-binding protein [Bradyrhizobium sp. Leo170]|uniref:TOMM precursor leader peptide-binding protein n=1 Tax=Bradyrhizobium sp. Leo170 TaxID=1571199 RepID=UPI00102E69B6|nr:TOMM precursor leader peptide-binding protein [Bradyrhizobium sp. Leo170]TAI61219.1 hypothetical protein CWO89_36380 [Bradyrhizobium sp. Leo170]